MTLQYIVYTNYLTNVLTFVWHQIYWQKGIINPIAKDSSKYTALFVGKVEELGMLVKFL